MGIVAFQWEDKRLTLLQNRESFDSWETKPAAWDENNQILRGPSEKQLWDMVWYLSRRGRVAFLVDAMLPDNLSPSVLRPVDFLRGEMSPRDFARKW